VFSENSKILVSKLQKELGSECFNVYPYITRCALDIICGELMAKTTVLGCHTQSLSLLPLKVNVSQFIEKMVDSLNITFQEKKQL
jgi:hypothetical protein